MWYTLLCALYQTAPLPQYKKLNAQEFVYFTKGDDTEVPESFISDLEVLRPSLSGIDIHYLRIPGVFGLEIIKQLSKEWNIPINFIFISSPINRFSHRLSDLGGVRLII